MDEDLPAFLRLTREQRAAGWQRFRAHACNYPKCDGGNATGYCHTKCRTVLLDTRGTDANGPGSVARRLGYPENPRDRELRADLAALDARQQALARAADQVRFDAMRERAARDKADRAAVAEAVSAARRGSVKVAKMATKKRSKLNTT